MSDYWNHRWNRRRVLTTAGATGVGAASLALVGCGDDDKGSSGSDTSRLATPTSGPGAQATVDPFAGVKRGGVWNITYATGDPASLDPFAAVSAATKTYANFMYSRLMKYKTGPGIKNSDVTPTLDAAESVETSPDGLKWTFKLRKDAKFQNIAPVNGRVMNTDDFKYSYARSTEAKNGNASRLTSTIDKVEYPDTSTIVMTLKTPNSAFADLMADANLIYIVPNEADGKFNLATTSIGSGPWIRQSYTPSVGMEFVRNPEWFGRGPQNLPFLDGVNVAFTLEYATRLAQFLSGQTDTEAPTADDLLRVKDQIKDVQLFAQVTAIFTMVFFDSQASSPWAKDDRIRQAISMSVDRDALLDLAYNLKKLKAGGIDVNAGWNNIIPAGMTRFWLDPQSKDQGETAQYFKYDPANAKKLLSAAGLDGFSTPLAYVTNAYGKAYNDNAEAVLNYINNIGIKATSDVQDYASKFITSTFLGNFKGMAYNYETPFPEAGAYPQRLFTDNPANHSKIADPTLTALANKQQVEMDEKKRKEIFFDIQRENAKHMYYVPMPFGGGPGWSASHPYMRNQYSFPTSGYGGPTETYPYVWKNK